MKLIQLYLASNFKNLEETYKESNIDSGIIIISIVGISKNKSFNY
jgi:hypothetical protein